MIHTGRFGRRQKLTRAFTEAGEGNASCFAAPMPLNLQFFASADSEGRTEKPTDKRRSDARKEGQVAKSPEVTVAFSLLLVFWGLRLFGPMMANNLMDVFSYALALIPEMNEQYSVNRMAGLVIYFGARIGITVAPIFAVAFAVGFVTNLIQVKWQPTTKPLKPDFKKLNPVSGFKKIFSVKQLMEIPKSFAKIIIIGFVIYGELKDEADNILLILDMELKQSMVYIADLCISIGMKAGAWYTVVAAVDYAYTRYKHTDQLKMTKQQIKDEYKNSEGDPQIKGKIRAKMREVSMRRMMQSVPEADVIITNPTHYAVAVKYDKEVAAAPMIIAKGVDFLAERIKKQAKEHKIQIVENRHLARALYSTVEVGQEVPEELYQAVAEVLAYVYSIKKPA